MRSVLIFLLFSMSMLAGAQSLQRAPAPPPVYGTVSGRVTCVDTNQPARLASVTLQTIDVKPEPSPGTNTPMVPVEKMMRTYQTALDGSFFIPKVTPGTYYVVIQAPGYISPITQFSQAELQQPTPEILTRILKIVPTVTVSSNQTANLETRIDRGAEFSGTISYDDGTPVGGTYVNALNKETKDGKETWVSNHNGSSTDDRGHFRITGLPPGEYLLEVDLRTYETYVSNILGGSRSSMNNSKYGLTFYSGDVARKDKGTSIKLKAGEQRDAADITIPVSKLHRVVGTLTEQRSGHVVNDGKITLKFPDGAELSNTEVDPEDNTFHFDFIPEGEYILAVTNAKDVAREQIPQPPGTFSSVRTKDTTLREYGPATQSLSVQNDISGLTINVPAKVAKPTGTQ